MSKTTHLSQTHALIKVSNLFVKWRVRYIENLDITNLRGSDQDVRYIEVIVTCND